MYRDKPHRILPLAPSAVQSYSLRAMSKSENRLAHFFISRRHSVDYWKRRGGSGCGRGMGRLADGACIYGAGRIKNLLRTLWKVVRRISIPLNHPAIVGQDVRRRRNLVHGWTKYAACVTLDTPTKGYSILLTTAHSSEADFLSGPRHKYTPHPPAAPYRAHIQNHRDALPSYRVTSHKIP